MAPFVAAVIYLGFVVDAVSDSITLAGAIVAIMVAIYGVFYKSSYKAASARADELEKSLTLERERHEQASSERREAAAMIGELRELLGKKDEAIARLEALPNLERVIRFMGESMERVDRHAAERLHEGLARVAALADEHERNARGRHAEVLKAIRNEKRDEEARP